jgi:hypothetical protein
MNELSKQKSNRYSLFQPSNFNEAMELAKLISQSAFCPQDCKNKPADVLIKIEMGRTLNLPPMFALQNIGVINGRPSIYGDAMLALLKIHKDFVSCDESIENGIATCKIKRKNQPMVVRTFSLEDAKKAGLSSRGGQSAWGKYTNRMLQFRARGFAARDSFPDALNGLISAEEAQDIKNEESNVNVANGILNCKVIEEEIAPCAELETPKEEVNEKALELFHLVQEKGIPDQTIDAWLAKAEVDQVQHMSDHQLDSCINYVKNKEHKNANTL